MKIFIKKYWKLLPVIALFIGNRIFNHVNAWIGVAILISVAIFYIYQLFNLLKEK